MSIKNTTNINPKEIIRLNAIFQTASDGIITIDKQGVIQSVNPAISTIFGYEEDELLGQNIGLLMPSPLRDRHNDYLENFSPKFHSDVVGHGRELMAQRKDGSLFPIRLAVNQMELSGGIYFTGILHDLTLQKEAEAEIKKWNAKLEKLVEKRTMELAKTISRLKESNQKLEQENRDRKTAEAALIKKEKELMHALEKEKALNELKSRFISMASHEFRTPLSSILGATELIELYDKESQQPKRKKNVARIKSAVGTLISILNDFLSLSRLEEGEISQQAIPFNIKCFFEENLKEFNGILKKRQQIQYIGTEIDLEVNSDKNILKNILINLISNAAKYSAEHQTIICQLTIENKNLCLSITDEGIGIPLEDQTNLFTRFFRAHNVENIQGTGLGLNITKRYVEMLGGNISFVSKLGKGTTFFVKLPLKEIE